jgi:hypothetical protein
VIYSCSLDVPYTKGFLSEGQKNDHFQKHGSEFAVATVEEYLDSADTFLGGVKPAHVLECRRRKGGDVVRFDPKTETFGILGGISGSILTFYRPIPCNQVPAAQRRIAQLSRRCHTESDNVGYFRTVCAS